MRLITALLASTFALAPGAGEAQLLPAGEFAARDGRPGPGKTWKLSDEQGTRLAAAITQIATQTPIVIDYEHQTLRAEKNGQPAPAAGWILSAEWRPGRGMFAKVDWTPPARQRIDAKEYLYISPVITSDDDTGEVTGVALAALVNYPALLGMDPVVAQLATQFSQQEQSTMTILAALLLKLGLPATTTEADALSAVGALVAKASAAPTVKVPTALVTALNLKADAGEPEALSAIAALKTPDTSTLQAMTALQGQVATLTAQLNEGKVEKIVDDAIKANKLVPAMRDWAVGQGKKDLAVLQGYIAAAPVVPGLGGQSGGNDPGTGGSTHALSAAQLAIAKQLGLEPEKYAKHLQDEETKQQQAATV